MALLGCITLLIGTVVLLSNPHPGLCGTIGRNYFSTNSDDIANVAKKSHLNPVLRLLGEVTNFVSYPRSCVDVQRRVDGAKSGVYKVLAYCEHGPSYVNVYCDMDTDGGGWLVFQRRKDGSVNFYRDWLSYTIGFGSLTGEFWLGNDLLHQLNCYSHQELRIDMKDGVKASRYAKYNQFKVGSESEKFRLTVAGYSGNAGDSLIQHNGNKFSTKDKDNDVSNSVNCAQKYKAAWWYRACHSSSLNAHYLNGKHYTFANGINWKTWHGYHYSLQFTEMKMRPLASLKP